MQFNRSSVALVLLLALASSAHAVVPGGQAPVTVHVAGNRPTVVAFLPPSFKSAARAQELVQSAVQDTKLCLGKRYATYKVVFAERIVVRSPGHRETFELGRAQLVGALLLRPGTNARIVFAGGGPEALGQLLPSTASEYFGKACNG
jgi:hypothetical protein